MFSNAYILKEPFFKKKNYPAIFKLQLLNQSWHFLVLTWKIYLMSKNRKMRDHKAWLLANFHYWRTEPHLKPCI